MRYIYKITETSSGTTEFVSSARPLNQAEQLILKGCLEESKQIPIEDAEDITTYDMVESAMDKFKEKTGKSLRFVEDPVDGELVF